VKDLIKQEKKKIGTRIKKLRVLLNLTQLDLGKTLGISKGTIASMEAGKSFTGDYLLSVVYFFGMDLVEFFNYDEPLPNELELREHIKSFHQKNNSNQYHVLERPPSVKAIIENRLIASEVLSSPRSISEIIDYISSEYKITFNSSVVSQAMINATKQGLIKRIKSSGRNYQYQLKKKK
jgi:transcriptional regulator with XRE-family HTH domain